LSVREALDAGQDREAALAAIGGGAGARQRLEKRLARCDRARLLHLQQQLLQAERRVKREGWREPLQALELLALSAFRPASAPARSGA
jgi:hypothetical protein